MGSGFLHDAAAERLTVEQVKAAIAATGLLPITGGGDVEVQTDGRGGTAIGSRAGAMRVTDFRLAAITDAGPAGEADYTSCVYWTQAAAAAAGTSDATLRPTADAGGYPSDWWVPAHNLAEWTSSGGSHSLPTNSSRLVIVFRLVDAGGEERFVFDASPEPPARLYITAILSGGAKYTVQKVAPPTADIDDSSDAAPADIGAADGTDAIAVDLNEIGRANSSHLNDVDTIVEGQLLRVNSDGTKVYTIQAAPGPGDAFRVNVSQSGGANGSNSAAPTYTYDVTATNGETLGSAVAVDMARPFGEVTAGGLGWAHYTAAGTLHLDWVDEVPTTDDECTP